MTEGIEISLAQQAYAAALATQAALNAHLASCERSWQVLNSSIEARHENNSDRLERIEKILGWCAAGLATVLVAMLGLLLQKTGIL